MTKIRYISKRLNQACLQISVYLLALFLLFANASGSASFAESMSNPSFRIELDNKYKQSINESDNSESDEADILKGQNYQIWFGANNKTFFGLTADTALLQYGNLTAGEPITRTLKFNIRNSPKQAMGVFIYEDHPLRSNTKEEIPDTTCDNGSCSELTPASWANPLTYGFGFRCNSINNHPCIQGFTDKTMHKQVANQEKKELIIPAIISDQDHTKNELVFSINIPGSQKQTNYSNTIYLLISPIY